MCIFTFECILANFVKKNIYYLRHFVLVLQLFSLSFWEFFSSLHRAQPYLRHLSYQLSLPFYRQQILLQNLHLRLKLYIFKKYIEIFFIPAKNIVFFSFILKSHFKGNLEELNDFHNNSLSIKKIRSNG